MKRLATLLLLAASAAGLLTGCEALPFCAFAEDPTLAVTCSTPATILYPICNLLHCPDHPTMLRLADNRLLNPLGPEWTNFRAGTGNAHPTQVLINYTSETTPAVYPWGYATITCISAVAE